jgi:hypothetical protein
MSDSVWTYYRCRATGSCWRVDEQDNVEFRAADATDFRRSICKAYTLKSDPLLVETTEEPAPRKASSNPQSAIRNRQSAIGRRCAMSAFLEMADPEHRTDVAEELVQLAQNIRSWQDVQSPRVSDEQMLRRFPALGSTKTYRRLREADLDGLVCDNHLPKYRGVWAQIEALLGAAAREPLYEDLTPALESGLAVAGLIPQRGKTRLVIIEGPTGSGKTSALEIIAGKYAGSVAMAEAHEGWASLNCALGDIALALGAVSSRDDLPSSTSDRLAACVTCAQRGRRILAIDEGHHCTAAVLNALKTFLNLTDSVVVIACIDTLWRKLTSRAWEEARQLIHNRLYERVRLAPPASADVVTFLSRRVPKLTGDWKSAAGKVAVTAHSLGSYAFLRRVAEKLNAQPDEPDAGAILAAASQLKTSLETR